MKPTTLVGMYVVIDNPTHEHFRVAQVVSVAGDCVLVEFETLDPRYPPQPIEMFTLEELADTCDRGIKLVSFFKTRADLFVWLDWLSEPMEKPARQQGKIVQLKPH